MMERRSFIKNTGLSAAGLLLAPQMNLMPQTKHIGLQLWSVREEMKKDAKGTLASLRKMGYKEIEHAGYVDGKYYGMTPNEFGKYLKEIGMKMPSGHTALKPKDIVNGKISDWFKRAVDDAAEVCQKYIINPWMDVENRNENDVKKLCEIFNKAGEICQDKGIQFGYHNHDFELTTKFGDKSLYETILQNTDSKLVKMEIDLYWVNFAGQNPLDWFNKYPGRFELCHVKDMAKTKERQTIEVGEGSIDFNAIFKYKNVAGLKYFIVELEHYNTTPMKGVELALKNTKKLAI